MGCLSLAKASNRIAGEGKSVIRLAIAQLLKDVNRVVYACDIGIGVRIADNCKFPHQGLGTTIHPEASIGEGCIIYQGMTIGQDGVAPGVPVIGDNVVLGCHSSILGPVTIADGVIVGAGAVVVSSVPENAVVGGVPAKIIKYTTE